MPENSIVEFKKFFSTDEKPVTPSELREFWESLTEEEKREYRNLELT